MKSNKFKRILKILKDNYVFFPKTKRFSMLHIITFFDKDRQYWFLWLLLIDSNGKYFEKKIRTTYNR